MTYEVIARKWRPKVFEDLIGQDHIARTLKNAVVKNRVGHAYLFSGLRGIGKTSSARVFARALRCERRLPDGNPCNTCPSCEEIFVGRSMDVLEIDGASNNGVDSIRELRERAHFLPSTGRYKITIIDEVHMLSVAAFNALLKILEEPPAHLIFMFATTEPQDIPETILSRVQRFDFKRIAEPLLIKHLQHICASEKISIEQEALHLIANASEGSMRDAQSMLDQLLAFADGPVTAAMAEDILGLIGQASVLSLLESIVGKDTKGMLAYVHRLHLQGVDFRHFFTRLIEVVRDCNFLSIAGADVLSEVTPEILDRMKNLVAQWPSVRWRMCFQVLAKGFEKLTYSPVPKMTIEMTLARVMALEETLSIEEMAHALSSHNSVGDAAAAPAKASHPTTSKAKAGATGLTTSTATVSSSPALPSTPSWAGWIHLLRDQRPSLAASFENAKATVQLPTIYVQFPENSFTTGFLKDAKIMKELTDSAKGYFGSEIQWRWEAPKEGRPVNLTEEKKQKIVSDERVKLAQKYLGAELEAVQLSHKE